MRRFRTIAPGVPSFVRSVSASGAMRRQLCAPRNDDLLRFEFLSSHLAGLRPAESHCENSGKSDDTCASARSDRAKSEVFRDRSASAGVVARYFSPCLIFGCFWIKPKAQKKKIHDRRNRFFGKNSDAKIGCTVSAGRSLRRLAAGGVLRSVAAVDNTPPRQSRIKFALFSA